MYFEDWDVKEGIKSSTLWIGFVLVLVFCVYCCIFLFRVILYCIVLYCIVLYCIVLYCIVVLYCVVLCCGALCCVVLCCVVLCMFFCRVVLHFFVLLYSI